MERCEGPGNLFKKRLLYSVLSTAVEQLLFLFGLICLAYLDPLQPFVWLLTVFSKVLSVHIWFSFITLGTLISLQCWVYSQNFVAESKEVRSRFILLRKIFSLNYGLLFTLHLILWGIITGVFLELFEMYFDDIQDKCLSEQRIFLLANGAWFGVYFLIFDCRNVQKPSPRYLEFPVVHQLKFLQVKMSLFPLLKQAVSDAITPTLLFFIFYIWKGNALRELVYGFFGLFKDTLCKETSSSVWTFGTVVLAWFFTSLAFNIVHSMKLLFRVHLAEHYNFPISAPFGSGPFLTLHEAVRSSNPVIMQLGYWDLKVLAEKDTLRRDELFTLSHLGCHPYNWNAVVEASLKMIRDFSDKLKAAMNEQPKLAATSMKTKVEESGTKLVSSPYKSVLRNLSPRGPKTFAPADAMVLAPPLKDSLFDVVTRQVKGVAASVLERPGIRYFFGDCVELKVHHVMSHVQPVVWAVDGLSVLAATSVVLDRYGVALKDVPALITTLLELKQLLDRLHKMSTFRKELRSYQADAKMRLSLQAAVKRGLYRITIAFQNHVDELPVSSAVRSQLQSYVLFKEG